MVAYIEWEMGWYSNDRAFVVLVRNVICVLVNSQVVKLENAADNTDNLRMSMTRETEREAPLVLYKYVGPERIDILESGLIRPRPLKIGGTVMNPGAVDASLRRSQKPWVKTHG